MATKKTEKEILKEETAAEAEAPQAEVEAPQAEVPEEEKDPWLEEEEIYVPRKAKGDEQSYYVCVNDRRFMIPANGKIQKLPRPIARILQDALDAEADAEEYADEVQRKTDNRIQAGNGAI